MVDHWGRMERAIRTGRLRGHGSVVSKVCTPAIVSAVVLLLVVAHSPAAGAARERSGAASAHTIDCAVCHALAVEVELELEKTANSTEVIELSRRPSSDLGECARAANPYGS